VIVICNRKTKECSVYADMQEYIYKGDYALYRVDQKLQKLLEDDLKGVRTRSENFSPIKDSNL